jgi:hypothetical protein
MTFSCWDMPSGGWCIVHMGRGVHLGGTQEGHSGSGHGQEGRPSRMPRARGYRRLFDTYKVSTGPTPATENRLSRHSCIFSRATTGSLAF